MDYWHCARVPLLAPAGLQRLVPARQTFRRLQMPPVARPGVHRRAVHRWHRRSAPGRRATIMPEPRCRSPNSASLRLQPLPGRRQQDPQFARFANWRVWMGPERRADRRTKQYPGMEIVEQAGCNSLNQARPARGRYPLPVIDPNYDSRTKCAGVRFPLWTNTLSKAFGLSEDMNERRRPREKAAHCKNKMQPWLRINTPLNPGN